jgi:hypothetical protein
MKSKRLILLIALLVALLSQFTWLFVPPHDPLFHGKPEREWIKRVGYNGDENRTRQWRELGPGGLRVLARAVEKADHPIKGTFRRAYRYLWSKLPGLLMCWLPNPGPVVTGGPPMNINVVLSRLGKDANLAAPAVARALKSEEGGVRRGAINFFTWGEGDNCLWNQMEPKAKRKLLPDLIRGLEDKGAGWALVYRATLALQHYPELLEVVMPVLVKALRDPSPWVCQCAAEPLNGIAAELNRIDGLLGPLAGRSMVGRRAGRTGVGTACSHRSSSKHQYSGRCDRCTVFGKVQGTDRDDYSRARKSSTTQGQRRRLD